MEGSLLLILGVALAAALASPLGGLLAIWLRPSSLLLSLAVGLAGGVLLGTFAFEMIPTALEMVALPWVVIGFVLGFGLVYLLDLYVNRWEVAGPEADQNGRVRSDRRRRKPRGSNTSVLAGGTSAEEISSRASSSAWARRSRPGRPSSWGWPSSSTTSAKP